MIRIWLGASCLASAFVLVLLARAIQSERARRDHEARIRQRYLAEGYPCTRSHSRRAGR